MLKDTLLYMAQNQSLRDFVVHSRVTRGVARRFVAGESLDDAIHVASLLNKRRTQVALDLLGENVTDGKEAELSTRSYMHALDLIQKTQVDANISIKLTALGLDLSPELCEENLRLLLEHSRQYNIFVCIDMEGSAYTEQTLEITRRAHQQSYQVGTVVQSYLYRSREDVEQMIAQGVRIRLVKGAYKEGQQIAFQDKSDVDKSYVQLMKMLLARGNYPAIATHDEAIINTACAYARDYGVGKDAFEFQMLYGVRRDLQERLVAQGYHVRVYVPYGSQWYPYLMRRMAERPANLMFVMTNMLR